LRGVEVSTRSFSQERVASNSLLDLLSSLAVIILIPRVHTSTSLAIFSDERVVRDLGSRDEQEVAVVK